MSRFPIPFSPLLRFDDIALCLIVLDPLWLQGKASNIPKRQHSEPRPKKHGDVALSIHRHFRKRSISDTSHKGMNADESIFKLFLWVNCYNARLCCAIAYLRMSVSQAYPNLRKILCSVVEGDALVPFAYAILCCFMVVYFQKCVI